MAVGVPCEPNLPSPRGGGAVEGRHGLHAAGTEDPHRARADQRHDDDDAEEVAHELGAATGADDRLVDQREGAGEAARGGELFLG
jgi:hypothetical protein